MNKICTIGALLLGWAMQNTLSAQCSDITAPVLVTAVHSDPVGHGAATIPAAHLLIQQAGSSLPDVAYIITLWKQSAIDDPQQGDVIVGADGDGVFHPSLVYRGNRFIGNADTFEITAIGYNLKQFKDLVETLYLNTGQNCPAVIGLVFAVPDPIAALQSVGIYSAADVNDFSDVMDIIQAFKGFSELSIEQFTQAISQVNNKITGLNVCNLSQFCIGINTLARYRYAATAPVPVATLADVPRFLLYPNPSVGNVYVELPATNANQYHLSIYNLLGACVHQGITLTNSTMIDVSNWKSGVYMVEINDLNGNIMSKKLMVQP